MAEVVHTKPVADGVQVTLADPYHGNVAASTTVPTSQDILAYNADGTPDLANSIKAGDPFIQNHGLFGQSRFVVDPTTHTLRFDDGTTYSMTGAPTDG